jgi:hypothetical protein
VVGGITILSVLAIFVLYPRVGEWAIRNKALPKLRAKLDRSVTVESIDVGRGTAVLHDVVIGGPNDAPGKPLAYVDKVTVHFGFWGSLTGDIDVSIVEVEGARGHAVRSADGTDNFRDIAVKLGLVEDGKADDGSEPSGGGFPSGLKPDEFVVTGASFEFRDSLAGVTAGASNVSLSGTRGGTVRLSMTDVVVGTTFGQQAGTEDVLITTDLADPINTAVVEVSDGYMSLWTGMSLTGIKGTIAKGDASDTTMIVDLVGGYGGAEGELWGAKGWLDPIARTGSLDAKADKFTLDRISSVLEGSAVVDYDKTSVDAALTIDVSNKGMAFAGSFHLSGGNVFHPMLAEKTVRDISVGGDIAGSFDRATRTVRLEKADLVSNDVGFQVDGYVSMPGGIDPESGERRAEPRAGGHLLIPPVGCQAMLEAIPKELAPYLQGFKLRGNFDTDLTVDIDWADLDKTVLDGGVGLLRCKPRRSPKDSRVRELKDEFVHYVEVERDRWLNFVVGPSNDDFVPIWDVSPYLLKSLMTTEDGAFYYHKGFIVKEFRTALIKNLKAGYFRYGASSITMQVVKNVILYREKTLSRKLQELFLTWYIETQLSKDRIFEIYVNAIEYGPGLYGIGPAAEEYFGKHPRDLNPVEAAFFSSILPDPKRRYGQYCEGELWKWSTKKIARIVKLMHYRKKLTDDEFAEAEATELVFDRPEDIDVDRCKKRVRRAVKRSRPTNPMKK